MQLLSDPLQDRRVKTVAPPPHRRLLPQLFAPGGVPNWRLLKDHIYKEGRILKESFHWLINQCTKIMNNEPNLLQLSDPITIVGDIHGQFYDLMKVLELGGDPDKCKYLFLGDYVDRGSYSVEVMILVYAIKVACPKNVFLLRGNHECKQMTTHFNFRDQCLNKFDQETYQLLVQSFTAMPLCCVLNNNFFLVHGGISPRLQKLADVLKEKRRLEPVKDTAVNDLLWADPFQKVASWVKGFAPNDARGCSFYFNDEALKVFLQKNKLMSVIRAHEAQLQGYKMHWPKAKGLPMALTIFSAPNYCDSYKNKGALIHFKNNLLNIKQFNYSQHPYLLPNFMDVFSWSIPFVADKVSQIFLHLMKASETAEDEGLSCERAKALRHKIRAVSRMALMHRKLKEDSEKVLRLKGLCPDNRLPSGAILDGSIDSFLQQFEHVQNQDQINERLPDY